jgi:hypothetical protein
LPIHRINPAALLRRCRIQADLGVVWLLSLMLCMAAACTSLPDAKLAGIRYKTAPSPWPSDGACINPRRGAVVAKEVLVGRTRTVVIAGGPNPISDEAWASYAPDGFNQKNSDRHTLFTRSCFVRSPAAPPDCAGEACRRVVESDGYTWIELSKIEAVDCTPAAGGCDPAHVRPGQLAIVVTQKCHEMVFEGRAFLLQGPHGEEAVMHATADGKPTTEVALPPGWSLRETVLAEPLVIHPFGGATACFYNILRDAKSQSYHQIRYPGPSYP